MVVFLKNNKKMHLIKENLSRSMYQYQKKYNIPKNILIEGSYLVKSSKIWRRKKILMINELMNRKARKKLHKI